MEDSLIRVMRDAAFQAGRALKRDLGELEHLQRHPKGVGDFVSAADIRSERILRQLLERARPGFGFLTEESGEIRGEDPHHRWIVDPLDGTANFLHGFPFFAISLALEHRGLLVAGVVYNPAMDEMFSAQRGRGAFLNDRRIRASGARDWPEILIALGPWRSARRGLYESLARRGLGRGRRTGSAALNLAYVAAGRFDACCADRLSPWDMAAGIVLVREAGGMASDMAGGEKMLEKGEIVAAGEALHSPLQELTRLAEKERERCPETD